MNGIVAARRSLPGNPAYDDPATAQQGIPYQAWSLHCKMALLNWCNDSGNPILPDYCNADPYWQIVDNNGVELARLDFLLVGNVPYLELNGWWFDQQPVPSELTTADAIQNVVVVPGLSKAGDHADFAADLTITGYDTGVVTATIIDGNGNTLSCTSVTSGDNRFPSALTINGGNAMTVGGAGFQIDATPNGCLTWGYLPKGGYAPTITGFTPDSGPIATTVTITGTNFTQTTAVAFNGTAAGNVTVLNDTTLTALVMTGTTTGPISVTTMGGTAVSAANFTVIPVPTITGFTPTSGVSGTR